MNKVTDKKIKILIAEHDKNDLDILEHELIKAGFNFESKIVKTEKNFSEALINFIPDIILSDYTFPSFDGPTAFKIKEQLAHETPFIFVSGTIGEESVVDLIKNGATDYALKDKLFTLPLKIKRALKDAEIKKEKLLIDEKLLKALNLYAFISQVNQNIVRIEDEVSLFRNSCQLAIEFGKFKMAWIGLFNNTNNTISLEDQCGIPAEDIKLFINASYLSEGPQGYILKGNPFYICNDITTETELDAWKPFATKHGINSLMVLPIKNSGRIIGSFNLYSTELNFAKQEEIELLIEVVKDISFALGTFEKEKKQIATDRLLLRNEVIFRTLIEKSVDMKTLTSKEGAFIYCSPSISKVFGYSPEEFLNSVSAFDFFHPEDLPDLLKNRALILEVPGKSFSWRYRLRHKNGNWIWCEGTLTNFLQEPAIQAFVSNFSDITDKKLAEERKEFERNNLNALINNTKDLMWSVDRNFNLITSNTPFDEMVKMSFGKSFRKGENVLSMSHNPELYENFKHKYERAFAGEAFTEIELLKFPYEFWMEISYYPIRKGNEVIGTACFSRDITERKISEMKLTESAERLKEAQTISHTSNWEIDLLTNTNTWSDEFYNIFGIKRNVMAPSHEGFLSLLHSDDIQFATGNMEKAFETLQDGSFNVRTKEKDGMIRQIFTKWKFEFDKNNKPIRLFGILQDVTENKLAEMEREKMISDIIQRSKNLEQFTYIISHNLRAPIANILGIANVLKGKVTDEDRVRIQQFLFTAVDKLDETVKDLNKILQIRSEITESKEVLDLSELVQLIKSSIRSLIQKENAQIVTDFSSINKLTTIKSYAHSIFYNLISNAIKYKHPGKAPVIQIKSYKRNNKILISFKDNGTGIDLKQHGEKVFGLYKRFHDNIEGKGLGLFMVKTQVEVLGGSISVKSELGLGTEFIIEFPN